MNSNLRQLISYLQDYNNWRREDHSFAMHEPEQLFRIVDRISYLIEQATLDLVWHSIETAPHNKEFLGVWGPINGEARGYDIFKGNGDGFYHSTNTRDSKMPNTHYKLFAWMPISDF